MIKVQLFLYKILANKIAMIIIQIIISFIVYYILREPSKINAMDDNNDLPNNFPNHDEFIIMAKTITDRPSAEEVQLLLETGNYTLEEMEQITAIMNRTLLLNNPQPEFLFNKGHIQDVGHVPTDHPDSQMRQPSISTTNLMFIAGAMLFATVIIYVTYRHWNFVTDLFSDLAGNSLTLARRAMLQQFELVRNNPRAVENVYIFLEAIRENNAAP